MEDPHLIRLGHYLEHLEGPEEVARLLNDGMDMEELEKAFLNEPWKAGLCIVRVVDPAGEVKPFIEVTNNKEKGHQYCPFSAYTRLCEQGFESEKVKRSDKEQDKLLTKVVGFSVDASNVELPKFKPWEQRECGGELKKMLRWKVSNPCQPSPGNNTEESQTPRTKKRESNEKVVRSTGNVTKAILKVLTKSKAGSSKARKTNTRTGASLNTWSGSRDIATEQMQTRKVKKETKKKQKTSEPNSPKEVSNIDDFSFLSLLLRILNRFVNMARIFL